MNSLTIVAVGFLTVLAVVDNRLVELLVQVALLVLAYLGGKKSGK